MGKSKKQSVAKKISKKKLSKVVFEKLSGSLSEYHLKDKKLGNRLEKVSKQLASDIVKVIKKDAAPKSDKKDGGAAQPKATTRRRKKTTKKEKQTTAVAE